MSKNKALKIINAVLLLLVINQVVTGMLSRKLPHEVFEWGHKGAAFVLLILAVLHLIMNWNWVKANYFRKKG